MVGKLDELWIAEFCGAERHVGRVTSHIAERTGAEIEPTAPIERRVDTLFAPARRGNVGALRTHIFVRAHWGRAQPEVPFETVGDRIFARWTSDALRPDRPIAPDMDLFDGSDDAALNEFDRATKAIFGTALVAHLGHDPFFFGELAQI